jgi:hypothetical protein
MRTVDLEPSMKMKKRRYKNDKNFILIIISMIITGCSSEFYKHDSIYKDWDHIKFSWWEYENPTEKHAKMSTERGWWERKYHICLLDNLPS